MYAKLESDSSDGLGDKNILSVATIKDIASSTVVFSFYIGSSTAKIF